MQADHSRRKAGLRAVGSGSRDGAPRQECLSQLRQVLSARFDWGGLRTPCLELGVALDDVAAQRLGRTRRESSCIFGNAAIGSLTSRGLPGGRATIWHFDGRRVESRQETPSLAGPGWQLFSFTLSSRVRPQIPLGCWVAVRADVLLLPGRPVAPGREPATLADSATPPRCRAGLGPRDTLAA